MPDSKIEHQETTNGRFLSLLLVDGKYTPSLQELSEKFKNVDVRAAFKDSILDQSNPTDDSLTFEFKNQEAPHVFALFLMAKGLEKSLFAVGPSSDFFENKPLDNFRVDGYQLALSETRTKDGSKATLALNYADGYEPEKKEKFTNLVHSAINELMPHLDKQVQAFSFK